ncbi:5-formyltetrahydrofolate cyclo-ligase [Thaumasiovibrio subtropicus]|uniref:5-formyltetrahydrofolate cyclo-ligase n=1 Tax=Thaumasiovibrio subtropicus TaxID=1891207 RepID=UPI000B36395F|nr:5-formyltetrahydrofolate cyclo-ligase [Thaumasiovibrio subtropicus]
MSGQSVRHTLRQQIRQRRQAIPLQAQQNAANALLQRAKATHVFSDAKHIALYLVNDGEIDPMPLIEWLWQQGKSVYLPVVHPFSKGHLLFLHFDLNTPLVDNRFGIPEPQLNVLHVKPAQQLDLICTPLVAFDDRGHRLGMGGGFYDRTLAALPSTAKPQVIGLAHDCQQVEKLPEESWDVPLPAILTPAKYWQWDHH